MNLHLVSEILFARGAPAQREEDLGDQVKVHRSAARTVTLKPRGVYCTRLHGAISMTEFLGGTRSSSAPGCPYSRSSTTSRAEKLSTSSSVSFLPSSVSRLSPR